MTRHHIIPKAQKELFDNLSNNNNIHNRADAPHSIHHSRQESKHPQQTLEDYSFFTQVMSPKAKELYMILLAMSLEEFYHEQFINASKNSKRKRTD